MTVLIKDQSAATGVNTMGNVVDNLDSLFDDGAPVAVDIMALIDDVMSKAKAMFNETSDTVTAQPEAERAAFIVSERKAFVLAELEQPLQDMDRSQAQRAAERIAKEKIGISNTAASAFIRDCLSVGKARRQEQQRVDAQKRRDERKQAAMAARLGHTIQVNDRQLRDVRDSALAALTHNIGINYQYPPIYVRGGQLVRVAKDENETSTAAILDSVALRGVLANVADWKEVKDTEGDYKEYDVFAPEAVAADIIKLGEWAGVPALGEIVNYPVFGSDGTLHCEPGYNSITRLFYTGGVEVGDTTPTAANVAAAKHLLLDDLLGDFPFKDEASKVHTLAYALDPFARKLIYGPVPPKVFDASTPGTGKTLAAESCTYIALGFDVPTMSYTQDEQEMEKRIDAKLLKGDTHAVLDNVNHKLDSGVLAQVFTSVSKDVRILGGSKQVAIAHNMIWCITANNISLSDEIARRCIWIRLDANVEKPWERNGFRHPDLKAWVKDNRDALVTACLTLIRAWLDAGRPAYTGKPKGSYTAWTNVMGGILQHAGIDGFLGNEDELFDRVVETSSAMHEFVDAWWLTYKGVDVPAKDLLKLATYSDDDSENKAGTYQNLLGDMITANRIIGRSQKLGRLLSQQQDKVVNGKKILKRGNKASSAWALQEMAKPTQQPLVVEPKVTPVPDQKVPQAEVDELLAKGRTRLPKAVSDRIMAKVQAAEERATVTGQSEAEECVEEF